MKKILMAVFSYYPADPRVRREAEALTEAGHRVDVICLRNLNESVKEIVNKVEIIRLNIRRKRHSKLRYIWEYLWFIFLSFIYISVRHFRIKYDVVHIHNMPDILILSSIIPKITGAKIVLDLHDPMPEIFMTKYKIDEKHIVIRILKKLEKFCIGMANLVLTPNLSFKRLFESRGCFERKIHIIMNSPQENIFCKKKQAIKPSLKSLGNSQMKIMFHGTVVERHGLDIALKAIASILNKIPDISFHVFGSGDEFILKFQRLIHDFNLDEIVKYYGCVQQEKIAEFIPTIDLGIIPNKKTPFTEINFPTRIFEYLSLCKPVIVPKTQGILDYFDEQSIFFFEPDNVESLAEAICQVYFNGQQCREILQNGYKIYQKYCWKLQKQEFKNLVLT